MGGNNFFCFTCTHKRYVSNSLVLLLTQVGSHNESQAIKEYTDFNPKREKEKERVSSIDVLCLQILGKVGSQRWLIFTPMKLDKVHLRSVIK